MTAASYAPESRPDTFRNKLTEEMYREEPIEAIENTGLSGLIAMKNFAGC